MLRVPFILLAALTSTLTIFHGPDSDAHSDTYSTQLSILSQVSKMWKILKRTTSGRNKAKQRSVCKSMAILLLLLIAISCDVETNPGPVQAHMYLENDSTVFPCGNCENPVTWKCKGVQCDMCQIWFHADCQNVSDSLYDRLGDSTVGLAVWKCSICENINVSNSSLPSLDSLESENPFSCLDSSHHSNISFTMAQTYTPKRTPAKQKPKAGKKNNIKRSLKVQIINCRSIVDKKLEFSNLVTSTKPDIIIGTESWLKPKHYSNEIFDPDLGYSIYRRDRIGQTGGGIFIAIQNRITSQEMPDIKSNCEDLWVKLELVGNKPLVIGAYYKPHESDRNSFDEFRKSLEKVRQKHTNILIAGDLNLPKMDWEKACPLPDCKHPSPLYREMIETFKDANLT